MDSPNTKISSGNRSLVFVHKFSAKRIITCQGTDENTGISLTKRDFRLQKGILAYKTGFSFTKRESCVTNGTLGLLFTELKIDVANLKADVAELKIDVANLKADVAELKVAVEKLDCRVTSVELHIENETDKYIQIVAENHINLSKKLDEAIPAANKQSIYELKVDYLVKTVDQLKTDVAELQAKMA